MYAAKRKNAQLQAQRPSDAVSKADSDFADLENLRSKAKSDFEAEYQDYQDAITALSQAGWGSFPKPTAGSPGFGKGCDQLMTVAMYRSTPPVACLLSLGYRAQDAAQNPAGTGIVWRSTKPFRPGG